MIAGSRGNDHAEACLRITNAVEDPVACIERLALDVHLRDQASLTRHVHGKMDVRCPAGIRHRPDGAEPVLALLSTDVRP